MSDSFIRASVLLLLMGVGWVAGRRGPLDVPTGRRLSRLLVNWILPALVVSSMQRPFSPALRDEAFSVLLVSFAAYAAAFPLAFLLVRLLGAKSESRNVHAFGAIFSNCAFMGFPVVEAFFGKEALFAASVYNIPFQLLAFSVGAVMLAPGGVAAHRGRAAGLRASSFVTPAAVAALVGFALFLGGVSLPSPLRESLELLGGTTTPLSMLLIGSVIARSDTRAAFSSWRCYATSLYRLLLFPLGLYLVLGAFGLEGRARALPALIAAMPVAANATLLSEASGGDSKTASSLVFVSTALSILSIPLMAAVFGL